MASALERMPQRLAPLESGNYDFRVDVLADVVQTMRAGPARSGRMDVRAPWGLRIAPRAGCRFHMVLQGSACLISDRSSACTPLGPGHVVLLPRGSGHVLADDPDTPPVDFEPRPPGDRARTPVGGNGAPSLLLCGVYLLERERPHPLLAAFPDVVHVPADPARHGSLHAAITLLGEEIDSGRPGAAAVTEPLVDAILPLTLRAWLDDHPDFPATQGWSRALRDPVVAHSLALIHQDPARHWTVADLAGNVGLSRAAFARRFADQVGEPPLTYLAAWRMTLAARLLREPGATIATVAQQIGYRSEFAFAKAFRRDYGLPPGTYRRQQLAA